ncbi:hypothetical protein SPBR_05282 [Sporothrix brasiliensis 5110]|uniref:Uncharacterized protein n=1 Tax=Sporothrix brasiliensis 5110 TaxID=1398154 RepID=A0A0C2IKL7_9PEZI|nr:uncharacterized protein SPBR_05282 [Sporothrix brasiliensis 5110]KIH87520.1 hypothetical protein SPBR_05282 [Sporothrix brasiliensis 5110]
MPVTSITPVNALERLVVGVGGVGGVGGVRGIAVVFIIVVLDNTFEVNELYMIVYDDHVMASNICVQDAVFVEVVQSHSRVLYPMKLLIQRNVRVSSLAEFLKWCSAFQNRMPTVGSPQVLNYVCVRSEARKDFSLHKDVI